MERRLGIAGDPVEDLLVGFDAAARRRLAAVELGQRRLAEDSPGDADRLDPLAPVLVGREVVEPERRMDGRVGRGDLHGAAGVGVHRPDVDLVAVAALRSRAVVADRERQEVEHEVRIGDLVVAPDEAAALEVVRRAGAAAEEQPLESDPRLAPIGERRLHRDRLRALVLDVDLEMVLEVLADAGQVVDDRDPDGLQLRGIADAGELEQLGRVDRAASEDHLAAVDRLRPTALSVSSTPDRPAALEDDPGHERPGPDLEVLAAHDRMEVGPRGAQPAPAADVPVELREALLAVAVDVVGRRIAGLLRRLEERGEQRVRRRPALEAERAAVAAERVVRFGREAVLHPLEVGQAVGVVPGVHPGIGAPALVVERVAALEDHAVDAAAAAEDLAAGVVDAPAVHERLRLRLVLPVVEPAADRIGEGRRHLDEDVEPVVGPAGLEDEDAVRRVGAESDSRARSRPIHRRR